MATLSTIAQTDVQRRVVLIDFDWHDADLLPELLKQPGISVRLVAGERPDDAGLRVAELCGLPRTLDLADLTREIFDLAIVSERSPRRTQVKGLLLALGTSTATPQSLLEGRCTLESDAPAIEAPLALHAAAFEESLGGEDFTTILDQSLPDLAEDVPTTPQPVRITRLRGPMISTLEDFPSPEDRLGLEQALSNLVLGTGAEGAVLHAGRFDQIECVAHVGPDDALLSGLVELALQLNTPQVVSRLTGPQEGKAWGAWPFQTTQRRGVLAAAAINPAEGWTSWERMVEDLRVTWDERDREQAGPAFPMLPGVRHGWLGVDAFRQRTELAIDRNRCDGMRFAVHRLLFGDASASVDLLCERLPEQLRDTDCICHASPHEVLLLTAGQPESFAHVRRRLLTLWEHSWREGGNPAPAPPITDEHVEIRGPEDTDSFLTVVNGWLRRG